MPAQGAVALALHLGMGTAVETLAGSSGISAELLGIELYRTRAVLTAGLAPACGPSMSSLGRYRDPSLNIGDRATLLQHAQRCDACRTVLEGFQSLDIRLLERIEREAAALAVSPGLTSQRLSFLVPRWALATAIVAVLAIVGIGVAASRLRPNPSPPQPATGSTGALSGWLLIQGNGDQLTALDLATGRSHPIGASDNLAINLQYGVGSAILSPNGQLIAGQKPVENTGPQQLLTIETLDGTVLRRIALSNPYSSLAAWLGNGTVLEVEQPQPGPNETQAAYVQRLQSDTQLMSIDVATGEQHEIFRGSISSVFPSPDSTLIVVKTLGNVYGGPAVVELRPLDNGRVGKTTRHLDARRQQQPVLVGGQQPFLRGSEPHGLGHPEHTVWPAYAVARSHHAAGVRVGEPHGRADHACAAARRVAELPGGRFAGQPVSH